MKNEKLKIAAIRRALTSTLTLTLTFLLMSCAAPERKFPDIVWPLPPEEPRIKFVEIFQSDLDVEEAGGLKQALLGKELTNILLKPYGVAVDREGRIYVTDIGRIFVFDRKEKKLRFIGDEPGTGKLKTPIGVAISNDGKVYVSDAANDRIFVYDSNGKFLTAIGSTGELESPCGLAIDEKRQRLYVVDASKHNFRAYSFEGNLLLTVGKRGAGKGAGEGEFNFPSNTTLDSEGNLYVVDTQNFRVQVFDPDGKFIRVFGAIGDRPGEFARPKGIAIDSEGHIYVVDAAFQNFQIFDKEGKLLLFVGEAGIKPGQFSVPAGMTIDSDDRIYVVDQINRRVQVFQYLGEKWKKKQEEQPKK